MPLVSIIIPAKKSAKTIADCLASCKDQSYLNIEIIIIDNNSDDNTKKIAGEYTDKLFNYGPERSAQRNYGIDQSQGDYILVIDSDMILEKNVIESLNNWLRLFEYPIICVVCLVIRFKISRSYLISFISNDIST